MRTKRRTTTIGGGHPPKKAPHSMKPRPNASTEAPATWYRAYLAAIVARDLLSRAQGAPSVAVALGTLPPSLDAERDCGVLAAVSLAWRSPEVLSRGALDAAVQRLLGTSAEAAIREETLRPVRELVLSSGRPFEPFSSDTYSRTRILTALRNLLREPEPPPRPSIRTPEDFLWSLQDPTLAELPGVRSMTRTEDGARHVVLNDDTQLRVTVTTVPERGSRT